MGNEETNAGQAVPIAPTEVPKTKPAGDFDADALTQTPLPEPPMVLSLVWAHTRHAVTDYILDPLGRDTIDVGREQEIRRTLDPTDLQMSRKHFSVIRHGRDLVFANHGPANGTFLDGKRLEGDAKLRLAAGALIRAGRHLFVAHRRPRSASNQPLGATGLEGISAAVLDLRAQICRLAPSDISVLVHGETGTGKEEVAKALHAERKRGALSIVNCPGITKTLGESELFGHVPGAFSGANTKVKKIGYLEAARQGTIFLDEIGDMLLDLQSKLLRAVESRTLNRVGDTKTIVPIPARFVAATHKNLLGGIEAGWFRKDLYYRLQGETLCISPLRERLEDILPLVGHFLKPWATQGIGIHWGDLERLVKRAWGGNARELKQAVDRACQRVKPEALADFSTLPAESTPFVPATAPATSPVPQALSEHVSDTPPLPHQTADWRDWTDQEDVARWLRAWAERGVMNPCGVIVGVQKNTLSKYLRALVNNGELTQQPDDKSLVDTFCRVHDIKRPRRRVRKP